MHYWTRRYVDFSLPKEGKEILIGYATKCPISPTNRQNLQMKNKTCSITEPSDYMTLGIKVKCNFMQFLETLAFFFFSLIFRITADISANKTVIKLSHSQSQQFVQNVI
jgi:hypothetical protein